MQVDLGTGLVVVDFASTGMRPSRLDLATAVRDSGFTVVAIQSR